MSNTIIVGLGNPGSRYANTWHNAGFWIVDRFAEIAGFTFRSGRGDYQYAKGIWDNHPVVLVKPTTFMNESGRAVVDVLNFFRGEPERLFVTFDDHDLPIGILRIRRKGSDGGHKGMRSIIECIGTTEFPRLRYGIRPPGGKSGGLAGKVLGEPSEEYRDVLKETTKRAELAIECFLSDGLTAAMNKFNKVETPSEE